MSLSNILSDTNKNEFVQSYVAAMLFVLHDEHPNDPEETVHFDECIMDDCSVRAANRIAERVLNKMLTTMDSAFLRNINTGLFNNSIDWSQLGYDAALEYGLACTSAFDRFEQRVDGPYVQCIKDVLSEYDWTVSAGVGEYWIEEREIGGHRELRAVIA